MFVNQKQVQAYLRYLSAGTSHNLPCGVPYVAMVSVKTSEPSVYLSYVFFYK